jgi:hypothetical protein
MRQPMGYNATSAMPEYRVWITVPGVGRTEGGPWEPFIGELEQRHPELGPIMSWLGTERAQVIMSMDMPDRARAAERAMRAVFDALHSSDLGHLYPVACEVQPAEDQRGPTDA